MTRTRRLFLEQAAGGAALAGAAPALAFAARESGRPPGSGRYDHLGRTPGYRDWAVVPRAA